MSRGSSLWVIAGLMVGATMLLHCGSDDSDKSATGGGAGSPGTGPIAGDTECYNCANSSCSAELNAAYGSGWQNANFSGACGPLYNCITQCAADTTCMQACEQYATQECEDAASAADDCLSAACPSCN